MECRTCHVTKPLDKFYVKTSRSRAKDCKDCYKAAVNAKFRASPLYKAKNIRLENYLDRLTDEQKAEIRTLLTNGTTRADVARRFGFEIEKFNRYINEYGHRLPGSE